MTSVQAQPYSPQPNRVAELSRKTSESSVEVRVDLDGTGRADISTGVRFYDHMLESLAKHSLIDLTVKTVGDVDVADAGIDAQAGNEETVGAHHGRGHRHPIAVVSRSSAVATGLGIGGPAVGMDARRRGTGRRGAGHRPGTRRQRSRVVDSPTTADNESDPGHHEDRSQHRDEPSQHSMGSTSRLRTLARVDHDRTPSMAIPGRR